MEAQEHCSLHFRLKSLNTSYENHFFSKCIQLLMCLPFENISYVMTEVIYTIDLMFSPCYYYEVYFYVTEVVV